jgi:TonB family protein
MKRFPMFFLAAALVPALPAASVSGTVFDPSGGVVPAAGVVLISAATGARQTANSLETGQFSFHGLPGGAYRLEISKPGFVLFARSMRLDARKDARVVALLQIGQIMESLEVTARGTPIPRPAKVRVGGNLQPPKILNMPRVAYPEAAKTAGTEGLVIVHAVVLLDGSIGSATAFGGADPELAKAAVENVRQWKYVPAALNGQPVETVVTVELNFRLEQ